MRSIFTATLIASLYSAVFCRTTIQTDNYVIWTIPDGAKDVTNIESSTGAAIIGGGSDCIPAFEYMINHANGGDFIILRAGGTDAYNDFVYDMSVSMNKTLNSVSTLSFLNREASYDSTLLSFIENAEMIFFSGGDQALYVQYWAGTPVQEAIQKKLGSVTVGGTSAGMAILGEWIYTSEVDTVYSDESLENPYNKFITFADKFVKIPFMESTITDTHFGARDRMGRYLTFVGRLMTDGSKNGAMRTVHGIAADEQTAILLDTTTGFGTAVGNGDGHVYICTSNHLPEVCKDATPLTFSGIQCTRLSAKSKDVFNFQTWTGQGVQYVNEVVDGKITTPPYGP